MEAAFWEDLAGRRQRSANIRAEEPCFCVVSPVSVLSKSGCAANEGQKMGNARVGLRAQSGPVCLEKGRS